MDAACDGEAAELLVALLVGLCVAGGVVEEFAGEAEVPDGDGDGDGVADFEGLGVGVCVTEGVGDGVAEEGIAWHFGVAEALLVSVTDPGAPAFSTLARAVTGKPASMLAISKAAASKPGTVTRTGATRIRIALSTLLIRLSDALYGFVSERGDGWALVLISDRGQVIHDT